MPVNTEGSCSKFRIINDEVLYAEDRITNVAGDDIRTLVRRALANNRKRARLCTHKNVKDELHEMLIVHTRNTYVRPHKHLNKIESIHIIEGMADLVFFNEAGDINGISPMGDYGSGLVFYSRISEPCYHSIVVQSERLVFHEVTSGPFQRADTLLAPWAPEDSDLTAVNRFVEFLYRQVKNTSTDWQ